MTAPLLLHVGYHKTATTWAQRSLFKPKHGYRQIASHREVFDYIVAPHGFDFSPEPMQDCIAHGMAALDPGEVPVISSEILSGHPFQGGHQSDVYAERLKQIAPDARILISIRTQLKILPSVYAQYVLRGGTMPYQRFFEGTDALGYFAFTPKHFEYDRLVARYQSLFGAANVHVLTQESLQDNMDSAASKLAAFAEATRFNGLDAKAKERSHVSYPEYALPLLRRINHIQSSTLQPHPILSVGRTPKGLYKLVGFAAKKGPIAALLKPHKPISAYVQDRFDGYFNASNARLANLLPPEFDLSAYDQN